jgi:hypothetical protein
LNASDNRVLINWTAGLSIFALFAHVIDAPDHLSEWWGYGTFFVIVASFQFFYGIALLLRPWRFDYDGKIKPNADRFGRPYFFLGSILTALVILVYCITRTTGMPFFGSGAVAEKVTPLSLVPAVECLPLLYCHILLLWRTRPDAGMSQSDTEMS